MTAPSPPNGIFISRGELLGLTVTTWVGSVFVLALLPMLLVPRFGVPIGVGVAYLVFFAAWQPVQLITQRLLGQGAAIIRMLAFAVSAALVASYLRDALAAAAGG